jgi:tetratricopeptide (TPR) repeat protein
LNGRRAALLAPALLAILLYLPTLRHEFVFDDRGAILENPLMLDLADLPRLFVAPYWNTPGVSSRLYRPVTSATFAIDRALASGFNPSLSHGINALLHGVATWLVTLVALSVLGAPLPACLAGLMFAVHPVHVEAVAGVVGRSEILAACGILSALLCHRAAQRHSRHETALLVAAPSLSLLAMLSKESAMVAPFLCGLLDLAFPHAGSIRRRRTLLYAGHGLAVFSALVLRATALGGLGEGPIAFVDNPAASAGPIAGRLTALSCVARYAWLLAWPASLSADYSFDQIPVLRTLAEPLVLAGAALVLGSCVGGFLLLRRWPVAGFALLAAAISFALTSNLVLFIGTLLAERLLYMPSVGFCLLLGALVASAGRTRFARMAVVASLGLCALASWRTTVRIPDWRDDLTLYRSAAAVSPRSARIRYNLGNVYLRAGRFAPAEQEYRTALSIYPDFTDAIANLGMALLQQGRAREALEFLARAVQRMPGNAEVVVNLGSAYRAAGDPRRAREQFRRAIEMDPASASAWNNLGSIALSLGDATEAVDDLARAVAADPTYAIYRVNLADALMATGRKEEAFREFREAYRLSPDLAEARRGMGEIALESGDRDAAERAFRSALEVEPPSARAANFIGYLRTLQGDARAAAEAYERALALDPTLFDAHRSLGMLYARSLGDRRRAAEHLRRALALAPDQPDAPELRRLLEEMR